MSEPILIGRGEQAVHILPRMANRHGLIAGATGTGKTVTLQRLAEAFSRSGVPVFLADVKGDLAGISQAGGNHAKVAERVAEMGLEDFGPDADDDGEFEQALQEPGQCNSNDNDKHRKDQLGNRNLWPRTEAKYRVVPKLAEVFHAIAW